MKYEDWKEIFFAIITICIVATTINRWNIGRYEIIQQYQGTEGRERLSLFDTKTGTYYNREGVFWKKATIK